MAENINSPVNNIALRVCRGGTRQQAQQQQSNFVTEDTEEETFVTECDKAPRFARKYFANLQLKHGEKTKVVRAQIDSASTCNTISSTLLRKVFLKQKFVELEAR